MSPLYYYLGNPKKIERKLKNHWHISNDNKYNKQLITLLWSGKTPSIIICVSCKKKK